MDAKAAIATKKRALIQHPLRLFDVSIRVLVTTTVMKFRSWKQLKNERKSLARNRVLPAKSFT
jgi:hypothetical protein